MKKYVSWIVLLVVLSGAAFFVWRWNKSQAAPDVQYKTQPIEKRRVSARVTASGTLQAKITVQVGAQVSGRIQKLNVDFNSTVTKGQLIAKLDPQLFQAAVEQARANFLSAKANVAKTEAQQNDAKLVLQRTKSLADQQLATAADLQTAQTNAAVAATSVDVAKASLAQSTAALHQAEVNLSYTEIHSPIDGTVISRSVDVGQTVAASLQAPVLFTIAEDLRTMQVHTNVAEGDVGRLSPGMDATFTVDAFPGQRFRGKVGQIRNAAQTVQNVVTYDAVIDVDNTDLRLRPGMTATVTIVWAEKDDAVTISNAAIRFRPPSDSAVAGFATSDAAPPAGSGRQQGQRQGQGQGQGRSSQASSDGESRTVWILRDNHPEAVTIKSGLSDGTVTEVVGNALQPGDQAIVDVIIAGKATAGPAATTPGGSSRFGRMF